MKALVAHVVVAESFDVVVIKGVHYFPPGSLNEEYFERHAEKPSIKTGEPVFLDIVVHGERNANAAWYYPKPRKNVEKIKGFVAFGQDVDVVSS